MNKLPETMKAALALDWAPSFDGDLDYQPPHIEFKAEAAVLILIQDFGDEPTIVLTQRTQSLRQHSGQVAFPGGRIDATDDSAWAAARRETEEEIGMPIGHELELCGTLSPHLTITGYKVSPFVAINRKPFAYQPEAGEVAEVFEIPLSLVNTHNFKIGSQIWEKQERRYFILPYGRHFIWGATARMLHQLAARLEHVI